MKTTIIPAKKVMGPDTNLMEIDNIWDYIDMYVEEDSIVSETNVVMACLGEEFEDGSDDWDDCYDDSWDDYDGPYMCKKRSISTHPKRGYPFTFLTSSS
jgi:hypothetical protein